MGNLKLTSTHPAMPANVTALPLGGDVKVRARRLSPAAANAKAHLPRADQLALADIAQRFAPGSQAAAAPDEQRPEGQPQPPQMPQMQSAPVAASPAAAAPRGLRMLIAVLIVVALLPSALFAAMIWLGAIHLGWPESWLKTQGTAWPTAAPASVTGALAVDKPQAQPEHEPAADTVTAAVPPQAQPDAVAAEAPEPRPVTTVTVTGPAEEKQDDVRVASPQLDPEVTQEVETTGSIAPADDAAEVLPYDTNLIGVVSWDNEKQALLGATGVEEVFTTPDETAPPPEHLMRAPDEDDEGRTWITAPQFVNLRKGPTSSAAVISIVAKGTKLEVLGRKQGWVKVANPETSETGWIYTGSKARRKRANEEAAEGGSFWSGLFGGSSD